VFLECATSGLSLADDESALLGWGHGWLTFYIVMDNHGFHRLCFTIAQIQR